jgi:hypothetical protein
MQSPIGHPLAGSRSRLKDSIKIRLPVVITVDLGATVQRRPLGLILEEPHSLDILHQASALSRNKKKERHTFFSSVVNR